MLLNGKNAGKLWDPENLTLKCKSVIIIGVRTAEKQQNAHAGGKPNKLLSNSGGLFLPKVLFFRKHKKPLDLRIAKVSLLSG